MEINEESYKIWYETDTATVNFQGALRLSGIEEYKPITQLLNDLANQDLPTITLNLKKLEFLNSSGISMLSKFVIDVRKKQTSQMIIVGSKEIPWQGKSLKNLQRLMPGLTLELT
ncbi:MAG TPA: hypothetical protein DDZ80_04420 [Cyanobacteria bacterium UBA8803]|nr:hypothetical protein [Cyanobacteria bacterium UBA9273]HBL57803.1 hypothetical protein [Cyanobacteria bacterium UBA8803]